MFGWTGQSISFTNWLIGQSRLINKYWPSATESSFKVEREMITKSYRTKLIYPHFQTKFNSSTKSVCSCTMYLPSILSRFFSPGMPNASIPTPQPVKQRKQFGAYGKAVGNNAVIFVSKVRTLRTHNYGIQSFRNLNSHLLMLTVNHLRSKHWTLDKSLKYLLLLLSLKYAILILLKYFLHVFRLVLITSKNME